MPDQVFEFLIRYSNEIWMAFLGVVGGSVRIAVGMQQGESMPASHIYAILVTGAVLAGTSSKLFSGWLGLGPEATSFCSFIVGIIGMNIIKHIIDADVAGVVLNRIKLK